VAGDGGQPFDIRRASHGGGSVRTVAGSPSSANIASWGEVGRRQPEPTGPDLDLLVAQHQGHRPAGHVEAFLLPLVGVQRDGEARGR
jgi:hypothetical protein